MKPDVQPDLYGHGNDEDTQYYHKVRINYYPPRNGIQRFLSFFLKAPIHDYTKGEEAVNNLYQQYTMLKNAIREMGGYEADEEID